MSSISTYETVALVEQSSNTGLNIRTYDSIPIMVTSLLNSGSISKNSCWGTKAHIKALEGYKTQIDKYISEIRRYHRKNK